VRFDYDSATHHYSDNTPTHIKLEDFILTLSIKKSTDSEEYNQHSQTLDTSHLATSEFVKQLDLRDYSVILVPDEIAQNRKRRWSKKFPICVCHKKINHKSQSYFLFSPTAKVKEMWFRRMKSSSEGISVNKIITEQTAFFSYMERYMPNSISDGDKLKQQRKRKGKAVDSTVHFSMKPYEESFEEEGSAVSITKQSKAPAAAAASLKVGGAKANFIPPAVAADMDWVNTVLARIGWDIWHEKRWYDWIETKIQRRISRIKTPSWMEPLSVTDIQLGKDVPTVKRVYAPPKLDLQGVWIYLAVQYKGSFTMTLETKLRLGRGQKDETDSQQPHIISGNPITNSKKPMERHRSIPSSNKRIPFKGNSVDVDDIDGNQISSLESSTEEQPTRMQKQSMPRSIPTLSSISSSINTRMTSDPTDSDLDSGSDDDFSASSSLSSSPNISQLTSDRVSVSSDISTQAPYPSRPGKWKNVFDRFKNSTIVQRAANIGIVRRAAERMSNVNLYLTVEVRALDGFLAVNMSPPPSDILW